MMMKMTQILTHELYVYIHLKCGIMALHCKLNIEFETLHLIMKVDIQT